MKTYYLHIYIFHYRDRLESSFLSSQSSLAYLRRRESLVKENSLKLSRALSKSSTSLSSQLSFSLSVANSNHSDEDLDDFIPTLSDNALSMENIQVESNLPQPEDVDNMAFYEQEKVSNRRNISLESSRTLSKSPEFRTHANTTPPPQTANSNTTLNLSPTRSLIVSQRPVISDLEQNFIFELTDGEIESFNNSKSASERLPITKKILRLHFLVFNFNPALAHLSRAWFKTSSCSSSFLPKIRISSNNTTDPGKFSNI